MDFTNALTYITLLLTFLLTIISEISAKPASNRLDDRYYPSYEAYSKSNARLDGSIGNLKTGYYYIDDGFIIPVKRTDALAATSARRPPAGRRRQDTNEVDSLPDGVKFTPLVRYKQTRTKRKKLFVPNFFG